MSPDRSFKASLRREFRYALSLQLGPAIEERTLGTFATADVMAASVRVSTAEASDKGIEGIGPQILQDGVVLYKLVHSPAD